MKKIMLWITDKVAPKMNKVVENPWVAAVAGSMMKGLPFILAGSLISFYNVFRSYVSALPDLGKVADFSFGFISIFLAFLVANQCMEKKKLSRYTIVAGLISIAVFVMFSMPEFNEQGEIILTFNRMGATGMLVAMLVGLFTGCIFNLYSKLHILENNVTIPDFVTEWINNLIPILCILLISTTIVFTIQFDIFDFILSLFSPLQNFGQTLPGFVLICLIPAVLYTLGVSNWLFYAASLPIFMAGIQGNIEAVAAGKEAVNIAVSYTHLDVYKRQVSHPYNTRPLRTAGQRCESPIHSLPYSRQVCLLFPDGIFAHGYCCGGYRSNNSHCGSNC